MPIKPENRKRYPSNWSKEIRPGILERAGFVCERPGCVARQYDVGIWLVLSRGQYEWVCNKTHRKYSDARRHKQLLDEQYETPRTIIVLTIAHLDHQPENCDPANLKALCQRHHLEYDRDHHAKNSALTRRQKRDVDQGVLL